VACRDRVRRGGLPVAVPGNPRKRETAWNSSVGFARDGLAAAVRLLVGDLAGVQVGVDRHLLARHRVEGA
jgi:hypothetical protein